MAVGSPPYIAIGAGGSVILLTILVAFFAVKKVKARGSKERIKIVDKSSTTWYDPQFLKAVPEQVTQGDVFIENGLLTVLTPGKRSKSAEDLPQETIFTKTRSCSLASSRHLSCSSQSLTSLNSETSLESKRNSYTLKGSPYVEFNLRWASSNSTLSVHVMRITSLPPSYHNATCSYKVTIYKPDNTSISKSSNKVRRVNLNPDCSQVFSFQVPITEVGSSKLEVEVYARKRKQFFLKAIGHLQYDIPSDLTAVCALTRSLPLTLYKKGYSISSSPPPGDSTFSLPGRVWGQVQIMAQYQMRGSWNGRIKMVVMKAQNSLIGKRGGVYKMELIVKVNEETKTVQETKLAPGPNPIWNMIFTFDVNQVKVNDYRVEMTLVRTSLVKKSTEVGHVALGLNTTPSGSRHWEDIMASPNKEFTVWHPITCPEE